MALDVASLEPIWPVAVTQLCRWSVSGAVVVLGPTGVPLEMDRLAAASPSDLADAVVVIWGLTLVTTTASAGSAQDVGPAGLFWGSPL